MTQATQFLMVKDSALINVLADDLATYLSAGWAILHMRYSEGGEGLDTTSLVLMVKESDAIYVRPGAVANYRANGYIVAQVIYGSEAISILAHNANLVFLDTPAFGNAEIGTVAATTLVVTFSTEVASADFMDGVTIKINTVSQTIESATLQADQFTVYYVIPAVINGDTVTWEYAQASGSIVSAVDGSLLEDVSAQEVTNNVPA
jgi:hypothetical protein